jgi:hypothetical protein
MNAKDFLFDLYQQWRGLSEAEGEAIQCSNWTALSDCQKTKSQLQETITHWTIRAREECAAQHRNWGDVEGELRAVIGQLMLLEQRNSEWLGDKQHTAKVRRAELKQSARNLRRVQGAYVSSGEALWNSYS